jgi:hypothetical protein
MVAGKILFSEKETVHLNKWQMSETIHIATLRVYRFRAYQMYSNVSRASFYTKAKPIC